MIVCWLNYVKPPPCNIPGYEGRKAVIFQVDIRSWSSLDRSPTLGMGDD